MKCQLSNWLFLVRVFDSMTTIADLNDKWAAYAGPGGWNGKNVLCELDGEKCRNHYR